jgi:mono/diheme cytochrome c family protein
MVRGTIPFVGLIGTALFTLSAQQPSPAGVFTPGQAEAGRAIYQKTCGQCHTATLLGRKGDKDELPPIASLSPSWQKFIGPRGYVAPLAGKSFLDRWGNKTVARLIARFQETVDDPELKFEGISDEGTVNLTAYILQVNGAKSGAQPMTRSTSVIVSSITSPKP